jgi:ElaB/YqjD/DUF883 family membrane-anchored ribosome-binding protein
MKNNQATQSPEDLRHDLQALLTEAEKLIGGSVSENSTAALGALRVRYDAAQERLGEFYETAKMRVVAGAKSTDAAIRANPYQSLAIAAGVGLLIGVLVGRRGNQ